MRACADQVTAYLVELDEFEHGTGDPDRLNTRYRDLMNGFLRYQIDQGRPAYLTLPSQQGVGTDYTWVPQGLTMRLLRSKEAPYMPEQPLNVKWFFDGTEHLDSVATTVLRTTYARMLGNRGRYLSIGGRYQEAFDQLALAIRVDPEAPRIYEFIGDLDLARGDRERAAKAYRRELEHHPSNGVAAARLQQLSGTSP